eukprot:CAMPEP_0198733280 /NCGR_PEP_ID=MMETSP1475-20131203/44336_1 /TAXON_ID= ORGANISM="Unidentified sp., Strain CCMP1999" /NCGR_SAMPLE_ID=MMETSP1475 /ASSEMBLY_ACC=CAM_ASM_001111 /LENGTH=161 /DNA_ID=CAMNT_0044496557 /DNA_START=85 /DNA_END=570 /DNA_ORIENTATION=+
MASTLTASEKDLLKERGYSEGDRVILFDGVCNMCNAGVNMVLSVDRDDQFKYAALQGDVGQALAKKYGCPKDLSTMIYLDGDKSYLRSDAVLRIAQRLNYFSAPAWLMLMGVPKPVRDWLYSNVLARYRYEVFGKRDVCRLPKPGERAKFLDEPPSRDTNE